MRAATLNRLGPPEALRVEDVPDPVAAPGHVVIDVAWASVTFVETQVRAGRPPHPAMIPDLPAVLGNGVAGTVAQVGGGVDASWVGRRVVSTTGGRGGYAERVAVSAALLIPVPDGLELRNAAALLADGRTALGLIRTSRLTAGEVMLVEAAAGGVGTCLVQLGRSGGATVIAGVGSADKFEVAEQLGADLVVDYSAPNWSAEVRRQFDGLDVVFDGVGGEVGETAVELLRHGGRLCRYGMARGRYTQVPPSRRDVETLEGLGLPPEDWHALSVTALERAASGELRATIGQEYPLDRVADAHAAIEARSTTGKTLLRIADGDSTAVSR
ncbi:MAG: NADPH:quinone reductase [Thermoleophilaceae bacterium]|nr:NADPH:quinone reductase [Thermoleophilaceae bacterium]